MERDSVYLGDRAIVIATLVRHARPVMLKVVKPDSCVVMSRLAVEVLRTFGVAADACSAEVIIANGKFAQLLGAGRIQMGEKLPQWAIDEGAWGIGLGYRPKPHEIGHVVCLAGDLILDLSLDQASRPQHTIELEPSVFCRGDTSIKEPSVFFVGDVVVSYQLRPARKQFKRSPDWRDFHQRYRKQAGEVVRLVRQELKGEERVGAV